jgi:hypothetical protein
MAHIDAGVLLPNERVERMALDGDLTQLHRGEQYADEGDTFEVDGVRIVVTAVEERTPARRDPPTWRRTASDWRRSTTPSSGTTTRPSSATGSSALSRPEVDDG